MSATPRIITIIFWLALISPVLTIVGVIGDLSLVGILPSAINDVLDLDDFIVFAPLAIISLPFLAYVGFKMRGQGNWIYKMAWAILLLCLLAITINIRGVFLRFVLF